MPKERNRRDCDRGRALKRQWAILKKLDRGVTEMDLAHEFGVQRRTILRDLNTIEAAGFPIYDEWEQDERGEGLWCQHKVWRLSTPLRKLL